MSVVTVTQGDDGLIFTGQLTQDGVAVPLVGTEEIKMLLKRDGEAVGVALAGSITSAPLATVACQTAAADLATPGIYMQQWRSNGVTYSGDGVNWIVILPRIAA